MKSLSELQQDYDVVYDEMMRRHDNLTKPVQYSKRKCQNICVSMCFIILLIVFAVLGIFYLVTGSAILSPNIPKSLVVLNKPFTVIKQLLIKFWRIILLMFSLSFVLSVVYMYMVRYLSKFIFYLGMVLTIIILGGIAAISGVVSGWIIVGFVLAALVFFIFICWINFDNINIGMEFLDIVSNFRKDCFIMGTLIPAYTLSLLIVFLIFWFIILVCFQYQSLNRTFTQGNFVLDLSFYVFWIFMLIFFFLFMYYVQVFMLANLFAEWYYKHPITKENGFYNGFFNYNRFSLGSIVYAALSTPFFKIFQYISPQRIFKDTDFCGPCLKGYTVLYLNGLQHFIQILNIWAVTAMALTGQGHTFAGKFAFSLILPRYPFMSIANSMSEILNISGIVISSGIPTILGYFLINVSYEPYDVKNYDITMFIAFLFAICAVISGFFVSIYGTSLCIACFFYLIQLKNNQNRNFIGSRANIFEGLHNLPQITKIYSQLYSEERKNIIQYKNRLRQYNKSINHNTNQQQIQKISKILQQQIKTRNNLQQQLQKINITLQQQIQSKNRLQEQNIRTSKILREQSNNMSKMLWNYVGKIEQLQRQNQRIKQTIQDQNYKIDQLRSQNSYASPIIGRRQVDYNKFYSNQTRPYTQTVIPSFTSLQ